MTHKAENQIELGRVETPSQQHEGRAARRRFMHRMCEHRAEELVGGGRKTLYDT